MSTNRRSRRQSREFGQYRALRWLRRFSYRRAWGSLRHSLLWAFRQNKCRRCNSKDCEIPSRVTQRSVAWIFSSLPKFLEDVDISKKIGASFKLTTEYLLRP